MSPDNRPRGWKCPRCGRRITCLCRTRDEQKFPLKFIPRTNADHTTVPTDIQLQAQMDHAEWQMRNDEDGWPYPD